MKKYTFEKDYLVEVDITPITIDWPGKMQLFLARCGVDLDGICVRLQSRCTDGNVVITKRIGRGRVYHLGNFSILADVSLADPIRRNGLHMLLVLIRVLHCLMMGISPELILWAPGLYGPGDERKAHNLCLRPMTLVELLGAPRVIQKLAIASWWHTSGSWTGLYCVDRKRVDEIIEKGVHVLDSATVLYSIDSNNKYEIPRVCLERVSILLESLRGMKPSDFFNR